MIYNGSLELDDLMISIARVGVSTDDNQIYSLVARQMSDIEKEQHDQVIN